MGSSKDLVVCAPIGSLDNAEDINLHFSTRDKMVSEITMNRKRCIDSTLVDSFLTFLRHSSDDIIKQRLNNYIKKGSTNSEKIDSCNSFVRRELYPNWEVRNKVINFCEEQSKQLKSELDKTISSELNLNKSEDINLRLDPYSGRDALEKQELRYNDWKRLDRWVQNNQMIESILQNTSDKILKQKCDANEEYLKKFWHLMNSSPN